MSRVSNSIVIRGDDARVFDLVTTAKYWPEWHPATVSVGGQTDRPMQLGDVIRERARIGGLEGEGDWRVVEYERPRRVVLRVAGTQFGDVQIIYGFQAEAGEVQFTRTLEFDVSNLPENARRAVEQQMQMDSDVGVGRLKQLVERMITPLSLPAA
jgi:hypothetical protein